MTQQLSLIEYPQAEARKTTPLHDITLAGLTSLDTWGVYRLLNKCDPQIVGSWGSFRFEVEASIPLPYKSSADAVIRFVAGNKNPRSCKVHYAKDTLGEWAEWNMDPDIEYSAFYVLVEIKTEVQSCSEVLDQIKRYESYLTRMNRFETGLARKWFDDFARKWHPDYSGSLHSRDDNGFLCRASKDWENFRRLLICPNLEPHERNLFKSQGISVFTNLEMLRTEGEKTICQRCLTDVCPLAGSDVIEVHACKDFKPF